MSFEQNKALYTNNLTTISSHILEQMKSVTGRWEMPWHKGIPMSINALTGKSYTGSNQVVLWNEMVSRGYASNKWATFNQWRKLKSIIKKGEKGTLICIPKPKIITGRNEPILIGGKIDEIIKKISYTIHLNSYMYLMLVR